MKSKTEKLLDELVKLHPKYIDLSLDRLKLLLKKLGNPENHLPKTIHIAGTNGKGSVQSFIRSILLKNGYKCDAYISPHLSRFNERIILNDKEVSTKKLFETLKFVKTINNNRPITFFEITTAAAFILFKQSKSDFLILETGLGGRLDATNIIPKKLCSILTPISFDHEEFLGKTLKKIANEKLGIVKNCKFVLVGKQKKELKDHIQKKLNKFENKYFYGKEYRVTKSLKNKFEIKIDGKKYFYTQPSLNGKHQEENASISIYFAKVIKNMGYELNTKKINAAIKKTVWPGRLEVINYKNKKIILDGSHNIDGAEKLNEFLKAERIKPIVLFGMLNNKKANLFLNKIKKRVSKVLAIEIPNEKNSFKTKQIDEICNFHSIKCEQINNINDALKYFRSNQQKIYLITGSLYLIGKIREKLL